ncbi:MAG: DUF309 domain-containing protein, partial [Actinomycetota bacterium]
PRNARPRDELGRPLPRDAEHRLPDEPDPATPDEAMRRGIDYFNAGRFFEAHEMWEFAWHPSPEPERDFWQGIIQVAVGFTHFQRQNYTGAMTLLERGARKLDAYGRTYKGLAVQAIASAARAAAEEIRRDGEEASPVPPVLERR